MVNFAPRRDLVAAGHSQGHLAITWQQNV
jgi:hypothetical protein